MCQMFAKFGQCVFALIMIETFGMSPATTCLLVQDVARLHCSCMCLDNTMLMRRRSDHFRHAAMVTRTSRQSLYFSLVSGPLLFEI